MWALAGYTNSGLQMCCPGLISTRVYTTNAFNYWHIIKNGYNAMSYKNIKYKIFVPILHPPYQTNNQSNELIYDF